MKYIQWNGSGVVIREIHGFAFKRGQIHQVDDDEIALDMLTQPNDYFVESNKTAYGKQNNAQEPATDQTNSQPQEAN